MHIHRYIRPLVLALILMSIPALSFGGVFVSVSVGPPPIPVYTQPLCPGPGYIWTPGYWAWGDEGYYWVPGTWVMPPSVGLLWTPGYWGWSGGVYLWHGGYWGPHVGWYGGINYGFGYVGHGYYGGEWRNNRFYYNKTVNNVNVTNVTNVYNKTVIVNNNNRVSYNGGRGGINAQPNENERRWQNERHVEATRVQMQHHDEAARNPQLFAKNNGGRPAIAATDRPGDFHHAVAAKSVGGPVNREALTATPKNMPAPRNTNAGGNVNARGNKIPRPGNNEVRGNAGASVNARNVPRPGNEMNTHGNAGANANVSRNVPKPPNAGNEARPNNPRFEKNNGMRSEGAVRPNNNNATMNRNVPKPPASPNISHPNTGMNHNPRMNGGASNTASPHNYPAQQQHVQNAPQQRYNPPPAARNQPPAQRNAPQVQQHNAPQGQHNAPQQERGGPKDRPHR